MIFIVYFSHFLLTDESFVGVLNNGIPISIS